VTTASSSVPGRRVQYLIQLILALFKVLLEIYSLHAFQLPLGQLLIHEVGIEEFFDAHGVVLLVFKLRKVVILAFMFV
jgi:hypothetical protein